MGKDADGVPCQGGCVDKKTGHSGLLPGAPGRALIWLDLLLRCEISPLTGAAIRNPNGAVYVTQGGVTCQAILSNAVEMPLIERRPAGRAEGSAAGAHLCRGWQSVFQPSGASHRRKPGDTGGDLSPRILPFSV